MAGGEVALATEGGWPQLVGNFSIDAAIHYMQTEYDKGVSN